MSDLETIRTSSAGRLLRWAALVLLVACSKESAPRNESPEVPENRPSILLVTLDTTRADSMGPEAANVETPAFNELARRGMLFRQAYATVPETLPSHSSMMTGLYPAAHGVHENARFAAKNHPLLAERLREAGYHTAAFVSGYPLAGRFGLARGFESYDEDFGKGRSERIATETTDRAVAWLKQAGDRPVFVWVHYFDPHFPYEPPEPYRARYRTDPYRGEIAFMDYELGRLLEVFEKEFDRSAVIVAADHGEGLGEHGEAQHGYLLYQGVMHVPMVIAGPGLEPGVTDTPVSTRRIFHTILDWAGLDATNTLRALQPEIVVGEAMKPFLDFGWQPQVMAVDGRQKVIQAGRIEVYDVIADPAERQDLSAKAALSREVRKSLREYPIPSLAAPAASENLSDEERKRLASLGYVTSDATPVIRKDAPRPADMVHLFEMLDKASGLFVREEYAAAIPVLERILAADPYNLMAALRLAAGHSALGHDKQALDSFRTAERIAPNSSDVRHYLALHYVRIGEWERAAPLLESVLAESPDRLPALEALAAIRERQGRLREAVEMRQKILSMESASPAELVHLGELAMQVGNTPLALKSFEQARQALGSEFAHNLELGVLYLDARRFADARDALDRVPPSHPDYAMALFKRAQVSVLLGEPDRAARIEKARKHADDATRELIARERLFTQ